jgi:putative endonuclease
MNTDARLASGVAAEQLAASYLQVRGLKIVGRNLRCKLGELDLVCLDAGVLAIVEVRLRRSSEFGGALASVTWNKQRKLIRAAHVFLRREPRWRALAIRFDVLAIEGRTDGVHRIDWVKDAFRAA